MATKCEVSREEFLASGSIMVEVNGQPIVAKVKEFSTGSFGYNAAGKVTVKVAGKPVVLQVACNLIAVGSKPETGETKPAGKGKKAAA